MGGRYFDRLNRNIDRIDKPVASGGDHASHSFVDKSRHRTKFSTEMDEYFGIEVNKSNIKYANIHPDIRKICEFLEKRFTTRLYNEYKSRQPQPVFVTKESALKWIESIIDYFNTNPEQVNVYTDRIIDVIVNVGKSKPKQEEQNLQKMQWKIVSDSQDGGANLIIDVIKATIEFQKDGSNIVGVGPLEMLFKSINPELEEE